MLASMAYRGTLKVRLPRPATHPSGRATQVRLANERSARLGRMLVSRTAAGRS